jgi:MarR family transcriptional regulator, organic hydroperoxide resistance regulator
MDDETVRRFERAYWRAFGELDSVRLRHWERHRVTLPQLRVLYHIRRAPGVTTGELAAALGITVSTTSGLVIKLAERGLVARTTAADDRRQAPLHLTHEGEGLTGELSEVGHLFTGRVAALLGDDLGGVTAALERLVAAASEAGGPSAAGSPAPSSPGRGRGR